MATAAKRGRTLSGVIPAGVVDPTNTALDPELVDAAISGMERETAWEARHEGMWNQLVADEARAGRDKRKRKQRKLEEFRGNWSAFE